jgi:hypothetical protein
MSALSEYLETIVETTIDDFSRNPRSVRHAYLACVATYHAIDRASFPNKPGNLRKTWGSRSVQFKIVDMVAHHFKHVKSDDEKALVAAGHIPLSDLVFGQGKAIMLSADMIASDDRGIDLHNLYYVVAEAIGFVRKQTSRP